MSDWFIALVPVYGAWVILLATFLSCLAVPVPTSLVMLAGGAFAAAGDLALLAVVGSAYGGALAGDQTGFAVGRFGGRPLVERLRARRSVAETVSRAEARLQQKGFVTVFLTRWLLSPLGPYVNFVGGAMRLDWARFTAGSATGEAVWVAVYTGLGWVFAGQIAIVAELASDVAGILAAGVMSLLLGRALFRRRRRMNSHHA